MRYDANFAYFTKSSEWYTFVRHVGYVPTDKAPADAVAAMERFNAYTYHTSPARMRRARWLIDRHPRLAKILYKIKT